MSTFHGRLGESVPDFHCETTHGSFYFYKYLIADPSRPWTLLLSHPADFTPVCTTEMGHSEKVQGQFCKIGVKILGISCDTLEDHNAWAHDILFREGLKEQRKLSFPLIADPNRDIVVLLGMLDPVEKTSTGLALPARAAYLVDSGGKLRLSILYPATTGRNYAEILRACEAVILSDRTGLATPVEWKHGDACLVPANMDSTLAELKFGPVNVEKLPSGREYIRTVSCPKERF